jgi:hypothetical protein
MIRITDWKSHLHVEDTSKIKRVYWAFDVAMPTE